MTRITHAFQKSSPLLAMLVLLAVASAPALASGTVSRETRFMLRDLKVWEKDGEAHVALRGAPNRALPGEPELPTGCITVEVPAGARVTSWKVIPLEVIDVPARAKLAKMDAWITGEGRKVAGVASAAAAIAPDEAGWFPGVPYDRLQRGALQGHSLATVAVRPVQYLPNEGRIRLITRFRLIVNYEENAAARPLERVRRTERTEQAVARALGSLGLPYTPRPNARPARGGLFPMAAGEYPGPFGREAAYVIVTADSLVPAFQPLADWKTRQGVSSAIVTLSQVQAQYPQGVDLPEKIRLYLKDAYRYQGTQWALIGGTGQIVPPRYAYSQLLQDAPVPADMYYGNLDGNWNYNSNSVFGEAYFDSLAPGDSVDFYPEVYVGRAPILNSTEATIFVNKTLTYDRNPPQAYLNKALLFSEVLFPSDYTPGAGILYDGAVLSESVADSLPAYNQIVKLYENNDPINYPGSIYETRQAVIDSLNAGYNFVLHVGHGFRNTMSVGAGSLVNGDLRALTNGPRYSFLISIDCTSGAIDFDCIGAASVTAPSGGAFAFWGSTREAFPAVSKAYLDNFVGLVNSDSTGEIGEAMALCKLPFVAVTESDNPDRWTQFAFIMLGDPSLRLRLRPASTLSVTAPASFVMGDPGYTVSVTSGGSPAESVLVCVQKPGDDLQAGYTDAAGQVTLPFQPDNTGSFNVTATKRNHLPYMGTATVVGRGSAYLYDYSGSKSVSDGTTPPESGNSNGLADAGESVQLGITVGNNGSGVANGVVGTLSTAQPGVTVTSNTVGYGSIGAHSSAPGTGAYAVSFSRGLRDGLKVPFSLHLTDLAGDSRDDYFTLPVSAPVPEHYAHTWVDSVSGPTHYTLLKITLRNLGSGAFRGLTGTVRPVAGGFTPLDSVSSYGNLAPGASWIGTKEFRFQGQATALSRFYLFLTDANGEADTFNFDLKAPGAIGNLAALGSHSSIALTWTASPDSTTVAGYYLYRSTASGGPYARVNPRITTRSSYYNDSGLAPLTPYYYYVTAADSGGNEGVASSVVSASTNPPYHNGWPIPTTKEMAGSPVLVNFTHQPSGQLDVFIGSDAIYAWHPDGTELRDGDGLPLTSGVWLPRGFGYPASITVADLFQDGKFCIVGLTQDSSNVIVWDEDGNVKPGWPHRLLGGFPFGSPAIGDIDGDGKPEVVVACGGYVYAWHPNGTEVFNGDGNVSTSGPIKVLTGASYTYGSVALADLDRDGRLDIIIGSSDAKMHAVKYNGTECRGWPISVGAPVTGSAAVADLDLDGHNEVVFPSNSNFLYCVSDSGTTKPGWAVAMTLSGTSRSPSPALADVNGDGYLDVVEATTNGYIRVLDRNGANLPGWTSVRYAAAYAAFAGTAETSPIVADIDGDTQMEILQGAEDAFFYGFNHDGTVLAGFPIRVGGEIRGTPAAWDLTNTGQSNIILPSWDKNVYVWDYPGGFNRARAPWPMFRHDDQHTGYYLNPNIITAVEGVMLEASAGAEGIRLAWETPPAAGGRLSWNVYRREEAAAGEVPDASPQAAALSTIPVDFVKVNDTPITDADGHPAYLDGDVRGGHVYAYILETLVNGQREALTGPLVRQLPERFLPARVALFQNTPNPFRGTTAIRFQVPAGAKGAAAGRVRLTVHDVAGRVLRTLADGAKAPGTYSVDWDGSDQSGSRVASGVYFYRLTVGSEALTRKILMVK
ncbi:MAG: VCBS repeat-containing protein [Candidatus Eisenbacteria bacterium]|nr:VCBS repeat-containing protein [Candidatus Eisenbacteria bacterium]